MCQRSKFIVVVAAVVAAVVVVIVVIVVVIVVVIFVGVVVVVVVLLLLLLLLLLFHPRTTCTSARGTFIKKQKEIETGLKVIFPNVVLLTLDLSPSRAERGAQKPLYIKALRRCVQTVQRRKSCYGSVIR